jgi:hypothetical protein
LLLTVGEAHNPGDIHGLSKDLSVVYVCRDAREL